MPLVSRFWTEIIRQDIQFLDLGELETTQKLSTLQDQICNLFLDSRLGEVLNWFEPLRKHIDLLAKDFDKHADKLKQLQHALVELIDFLDPDCSRYPKERRAKIGL